MNIEKIKALVEILEESSLSKLEIEEKDLKVKLEKFGGNAVMSAPQSVATVPTQALTDTNQTVPATEGEVITSPMVGTFYSSPSPDSPAFIKIGSPVAKGDKICILEAMKIFNEIEAEFDCTILEFLVEDGEVVEYDTPLFRVEKK